MSSKPNFQDSLKDWHFSLPNTQYPLEEKELAQLLQLFKDYIKECRPDDYPEPYNNGISEYYDNLKGGLK
jgi:hypothetical protein